MSPEEWITPQQGFNITINRCKGFPGLDHEIGSIRSGKKAILLFCHKHPLEVDPTAIKDINIEAYHQFSKRILDKDP